MIKHFVTFAVLCFTIVAYAQTPGNISLEGRLSGHLLRPRTSCSNYAGTLHFGLFNGQSNTVGEKLVFLCANDSLEVIHNGDFNVDGDPDRFTPPGIRYAYFDCPPSVTGPSLSAILKDSCLNRTSPIFVNGQPVTQSKGIWITEGGTSGGDLKLYNKGQLQSAFANGKPVSFWFAPLTIDNFTKNEYEKDPVTGESGSCVHLNTDAAFQVVYLNPIEADQIKTNIDGQGCQASFVVKGGLPEYDSTTQYSFQIQMVGNPSVQGYLLSSGNSKHLDTIRFFVPQPGNYQVIVSDGKSCEASFSVSMSGCNTVTFTLPFLNQLPGDSICTPVTVKDFSGVGALEMDFEWDATVLKYTGLGDIHAKMGGFGPGNVNLTRDSSRLNLSWLDAGFSGISVNNGDTLFSLCFVVIGALGDKSPIAIRPSSIPSETVGTPEPKPLGFILNAGQVNVSAAVLFFDVASDSVSCDGISDGKLQVTVANGQAPYSVAYRRINPSAPPVSGLVVVPSSGVFSIDNLDAGLYEVRVRDASAPVNEAIDSVEIAEPPILAVRLDETDPSCFGNSDGAIRAEILIDAVPQPNPGAEYSFRWSIPGETGDRIENLRGGAYAVTVTNSAGCTSSASTNLSPPAAILLSPVISNATCSGVADGRVTVTARGGSTATAGQYTFVWEGIDSVKTTNFSKTGLLPGTYCIKVIDDNGCEAVQCFSVGATKSLSYTADITDVTCNSGCDGAIQVVGITIPAASERTPYTFTWNRRGSSAPITTNTSSLIQNLCAGQYILTMKDSDPAGCSITDTLLVEEPAPIVVTQAELVNETCVVGADGRIAVRVTGGIAPYVFLWNNGQRDSIASNLRAGTYSLQVTDANACKATFSEVVLAPTPPQIQQFSNDTLACAADVNGRLRVEAVNGGAAITTYTWNTGTSGPELNGLVPGLYTVTILAADGCRTVDSARVVAPAVLRIDSIGTEAPRCPGEANGRAFVAGGGGTAPYRYIWAGSVRSDTTFFPTRPGLSAGTYAVTLTDANLCPGVSQTVQIVDPPRIEVQYSDIKAVSCFETVCDGAITATGGYSDGKSGRFTYTWKSGEVFSNTTSARAQQLCSGANVLVVVDSNACAFTDTVDIPSPEEIRIALDVTPISCNAGKDGAIQAQVSGGTPGYSYLWVESGVGSSSIRDLGIGTYTIRVSDSNTCVKELSYKMTQPDQLVLSVDPEATNNARCFGVRDGRIKVVVNTQDSINPLRSEPYTWSGNIAAPGSSVAQNLPAGAYSVTVTDIKGCQAVLNYSILEPEPIVAIIPTPDDPRCFGESTLLRIDTIYGGNGGSFLDYTYSVNNTGLSFTPNQAATVFAGALIVTIEDPLGCTYTDTLNVSEPDELRVVFDPATLIVELGDTLTALDPLITGTTPVDSFIWSPTANLTSAVIRNPYIYNLLEDQTFKLTVIDQNGCKASGEVFVELDRNRNVYIPNVFSPNGDGWNDELRVFACKGVTKINYALVYDRWGGEVFESRNVPIDCLSGAPLWNGEVGGKKVPAGVYVYMVEVEFLDGVVLLYRGDVTVFR